jgi:hypothetical protein
MGSKAGLAGPTAMVAPLGKEHGSQFRIICNFGCHFGCCAPAPAPDLAPLPPLEECADRLRQSSRSHDVHCRFSAFVDRIEPGVDCLALIRKALLQIQRLRLRWPGERQRIVAAYVQHIVDRSHWREFNRRIAKPVQ